MESLCRSSCIPPPEDRGWGSSSSFVCWHWHCPAKRSGLCSYQKFWNASELFVYEYTNTLWLTFSFLYMYVHQHSCWASWSLVSHTIPIMHVIRSTWYSNSTKVRISRIMPWMWDIGDRSISMKCGYAGMVGYDDQQHSCTSITVVFDYSLFI